MSNPVEYSNATFKEELYPAGHWPAIKKDKRFPKRLRQKIEDYQDTYLNDVLSERTNLDDYDPVREDERKANIKMKENREERLRKTLLFIIGLIVLAFYFFSTNS